MSDAPLRIAIIGNGLMGRSVHTLADGALVAARWLSGRTGVYTMADVFAVENT
jgi:hypothetical protein